MDKFGFALQCKGSLYIATSPTFEVREFQVNVLLHLLEVNPD